MVLAKHLKVGMISPYQFTDFTFKPYHFMMGFLVEKNMKYVLNKCLVENESGELVWNSTKPDGEYSKMETILKSKGKQEKELFDKFNLDHDDLFKIVVYLKDESKSRLVSGEVVYGIFNLFNFFEDGYCLTKDSIHKSN